MHCHTHPKARSWLFQDTAGSSQPIQRRQQRRCRLAVHANVLEAEKFGPDSPRQPVGMLYADEPPPKRQTLHPDTSDMPQEWSYVNYIADPEERKRTIDQFLRDARTGDAALDLPLNSYNNTAYVPFEFLDFSPEEVLHHVEIQVDAPIYKVFQIWEDPLSWNEWFDLIGQMIFHEADLSIVSIFLFYRLWQLKPMELYCTLQRVASEQNSYIIEQSCEGMPMVAAAFFRENDGGTLVNLRIAYCSPYQIKKIVGHVGLHYDVEGILNENMKKMKDFCEKVDLQELKKRRMSESKAYAHLAKKRVTEAKAEVEAERKAALDRQPPPTQLNDVAQSAVQAEDRRQGGEGIAEYPSSAEDWSKFFNTTPNPDPAADAGTGQEAEASVADFATPSGPQGSKEGSFAANGGSAKEGSAKKSGEKKVKPKDLQQGDPGGGSEGGASALEEATPSGPISPPSSSKPKPKRGRPKKNS
ncbi:hypothetical protein WJX73_001919 [Symbiochloris irregularis]|uniref:START domain-containing protein n=1 Tax=Symbiochloris irregularis TaxID=706552 RepID=A0AAW1NLL0_9CHLO